MAEYLSIPGAPAFIGGGAVGGAVGGAAGSLAGGATNLITKDKKTCNFVFLSFFAVNFI